MDETPWAMVKRLQGSGATFDEIIVALQQRGLPREDIELLLQDDPAFVAWRVGRPALEDRRPTVTEGPVVAATPTDWGRIFRWTVITLSLIAAGIGAATVPDVAGLAVMTVLALPAMGVTAVEYVKGKGRTQRALGYVLFFGFLAPALTLYGGERTPARVVGALLFAVAIPLIIWASRRTPQLKGLADSGASTIFELSDVQFSVAHGAGPVGVGEHVPVLVRAQNVVDAPRTLIIRIKGEGAMGLQPQKHPVVLEPGVISEITVPVRVPSLANGRLSFLVDFDVSGEGFGRRLRLASGQTWVTPSSATLTNVVSALSLVAGGPGVFQLGSNGSVVVKVDETKPYATEEASLTVSELYRPSAAELEAVRKG